MPIDTVRFDELRDTAVDEVDETTQPTAYGPIDRIVCGACHGAAWEVFDMRHYQTAGRCVACGAWTVLHDG